MTLNIYSHSLETTNLYSRSPWRWPIWVIKIHSSNFLGKLYCLEHSPSCQAWPFFVNLLGKTNSKSTPKKWWFSKFEISEMPRGLHCQGAKMVVSGWITRLSFFFEKKDSWKLIRCFFRWNEKKKDPRHAFNGEFWCVDLHVFWPFQGFPCLQYFIDYHSSTNPPLTYPAQEIRYDHGLLPLVDHLLYIYRGFYLPKLYGDYDIISHETTGIRISMYTWSL